MVIGYRERLFQLNMNIKQKLTTNNIYTHTQYFIAVIELHVDANWFNPKNFLAQEVYNLKYAHIGETFGLCSWNI